jgi:hypothetical protein
MRNLIAVSVLAAAAVPMTASATLVTQWQYLAASNWSQPVVFSAGNGATSITSDVISWGASGGSYNTPGSTRSALEISGMAAPSTANTNAILPSLTNSITHYNNVLSNSYATLTSAVLTTSLTLQPWAPAIGPIFPPKVLNFDIRFKETSNTASAATCGFSSVGACDDIFVIDNPASLVTNFIYDGYKYTVKLVETTQSLTALSPAACAVANAPENCVGFQTVEGQSTTAQFGFTIEGEKITVPTPATLGLLAFSLLGLRLTARRKTVR